MLENSHTAAKAGDLIFQLSENLRWAAWLLNYSSLVFVLFGQKCCSSEIFLNVSFNFLHFHKKYYLKIDNRHKTLSWEKLNLDLNTWLTCLLSYYVHNLWEEAEENGGKREITMPGSSSCEATHHATVKSVNHLEMKGKCFWVQNLPALINFCSFLHYHNNLVKYVSTLIHPELLLTNSTHYSQMFFF